MFRCSRFGAAVVLLILTVSKADAELAPDFLMDTDPEFRAPSLVKRFNRDFKGLWLQALQKPEADLQRMTAETVARAHRHGIPNLIELVPALETILTASKSHASARFAAARALIVLDSRQSAAKIFQACSSEGSDFRGLVEPALANWDFLPIRDVWIQRLKSPDTRTTDLVLAIDGLGQVRDLAGLPLFLQIVMDPLALSSVRLEAADVAGKMAETGFEANAVELSERQSSTSSSLIDRLCAVRLLYRHSSSEARQRLIKLASDPEASVAKSALRCLNRIDPALVVPLSDIALRHSDPDVRLEGALAYIQQPTEDRISRLAQMLDDPHPAVRKQVAEGLFRLADKPEFDAAIRSSALQTLNGEHWQGQSQAALLLGTLKHQPAAMRCVELLGSERPEVMISTAWALRRLAVPETAGPIIATIGRQTTLRKQRSIRGVDEQVAHLFEACAVLNARDVEPLIRIYIPKDLTMIRSRSAAIWALGKLNAATPNEELGNQLLGRFLDDTPKFPEHPLVKQMSVVGIVRMGQKDHAATIRKTIESRTPPTPLGLATRWAVRELTGEDLPEAVPESVPQGSWFLEPLEGLPTPSH